MRPPDLETTTNLLACFSAPPRSSINALLTLRLTSYLAAFTSWPAGRLLPINAQTTFLLYLQLFKFGQNFFCHICSLRQAQITRVLGIFLIVCRYNGESWQVFLTLSGIEGKKPFDQNGIAERVVPATKTIFSLYLPFISLASLNLPFFVSVFGQSQDSDI